MTLIQIGILIVTLIILYITYLRRRYNYWKQKNVPFCPPKFPFGNFDNPILRKRNLAEWAEMYYKKFQQLGVQHAGLYLFSAPIYFPISPEMIKNIMQNDFQYFVNRGVYYNEKDDPLSAHLFAIGGQKWRNLRTKLTPTFTSGKMKTMFSTLVDCTGPMKESMTSICLNKEPVIIKDIVARFTTDIIGSCAFGLDCDSFKSEDAAFRYHGRKAFELTALGALKRGCSFARPNWARKLGVRAFPKDSTDFFLNVVKDTVKYRQENNVQRKDMLQIVIDLQKSNTENGTPALTIEEIAAQAFVFFLAGFETSSTTMTFCLYEMAKNVNIQNKVREEVNRVLNKHGDITYDAIMDMTYMSQVIDETLRMYPPVPVLTRQCVKNYAVPGTDVVIEKDTLVLIPVYALQRDPIYFNDPKTFNPDRFTEENKPNIQPFTYLPFGEGPRLCIGMRFGMMQTKVGLATLLKNYSFTVNSKTQDIKWDRYGIVLSTEKPIWLNVQKVE